MMRLVALGPIACGLLGATSWAAPSVAAACSCGPYVSLAAYVEEAPDEAPVDAVLRLGTCYGDPPGPDDYEVTVDGVPASLGLAFEPTDAHEAMYRVEPTPEPGQTVVVRGCDYESECEPVELLRFETLPRETSAPQGTASLDIAASVDIDDGVSCPPFGPLLRITVDDLQVSDDVTWVLITATDEDGNVYRDSPRIGSSTSPVPASVYVPDTVGTWCVEARGMTLAGAGVELARECVELGEPMSNPDEEDESQELGCGCTSGSDVSAAFAGVVLLALRRRRRHRRG